MAVAVGGVGCWDNTPTTTTTMTMMTLIPRGNVETGVNKLKLALLHLVDA